ncbi:MAG: hypothetical protein HY778_11990 [Betaproteobacteria bacterium]|nr:hypothetical protein [Betaproteobacteria bacterium]
MLVPDPSLRVSLSLHPSTRLAIWIGGVLLVGQGHGLSALVCALALLGIAGVWARRRCVVLIRRARWLLVSIVLISAWLTPGEPVVQSPASLAPTLEGLSQGGEQALQLVSMLAMVAMLLELTPVATIIGGIHGLMWPLGVFPTLRERIALRLLLVLQYVESKPTGARFGAAGHGWRAWLDSPASGRYQGTIVLPRERVSALDVLVLSAMLGALGFWFV